MKAILYNKEEMITGNRDEAVTFIMRGLKKIMKEGEYIKWHFRSCPETAVENMPDVVYIYNNEGRTETCGIIRKN